MSTIPIEIVDVTVQKQGNYEKMTIAHNVSFGGKTTLDAKALVSFATPTEVWDILKTAQKGDHFKIVREKDAAGKYWQWVAIEGETSLPKGDSVAPPSAHAEVASKKVSFADQDARRQRLIVRQSSLAQAVAFNPGAKVEEVLSTADQFAAWVLKEDA